MVDFWANGGPNVVLSKFHSDGIEELGETVNFRALSEVRMSPEDGRKWRFRPELLFRERKGKEKVRERERDGIWLDLMGGREVY